VCSQLQQSPDLPGYLALDTNPVKREKPKMPQPLAMGSAYDVRETAATLGRSSCLPQERTPEDMKNPIRKLRKALTHAYQRATWRSRALPDFIIVGAMKSGTSSLFSYLSQHPQILPSKTKEVHFFDGGIDPDVDAFAKGQPWYRAHFPLKEHIPTGSKTFEASPLYIFNPIAPKRIFDLIPNVKIIAVLRNPTERAISHYFHEKRKGREKLSIYEAMQQEASRLEPVVQAEDFKSDIFVHNSYKSRGLYKEQIERYLEYFPRHQMLILSSEELFGDPDSTLARVFDFVGVDTAFKVEDLEPRNVASNRVKVDQDVFEYLDNYFLPHNQALYQLLGKTYGW